MTVDGTGRGGAVNGRTSRTLITNIGQLVTCSPALHVPKPEGEVAPERELGLIPDACLLIEGDRVGWVGRRGDVPRALVEAGVHLTLDARGGVVMPGLVDAHTHLVFGGSRVAEFRLRIRGTSYEELARRGGGIATTVVATRLASEDELVDLARGRLDTLLRWGVTTCEVKSGYGLTVEDELKLLRVVRRLDAERPQRLVPTFLGAHVVPPEFRAHREAYVDLVAREMLPEVARQGLARYCDVFCESSAFSLAESRRILEVAKELGLGVRLHAEQLSHSGATALGVELGAASVDHLECCTEDDIEAVAASDTTAVVLPGATVFLNQQRWAPARRLLDAGAKVAVSTDCNPGSCMTENLPLMGTLACVRMGMDPAEALLAVTKRAAGCLGLAGEVGELSPGSRADCIWLGFDRYENLFYHFGVNHMLGVVVGGSALHWDGGDEIERLRASRNTSAPRRRKSE